MYFFKIKDQNTPLYWAASEGHTEIVSLLVQFKGDPNIANKVKTMKFYIHLPNVSVSSRSKAHLYIGQLLKVTLKLC